MSSMPGQFRTKTEMVYDWIKERILSGDLKQGEKINIKETSVQFGVSGIPVREAVGKLQSEGLVEIIPHVGASVTAYSSHQIKEINLIRSELETLALKLAADYLNQDLLNNLEAIIKKMDQALEEGDIKSFGRLNREFHLSIYRASPYRFLYDLIVSLWDRGELRRKAFMQDPARAKKSQEEHWEMYRALCAGNFEKALEIFRRQKEETFKFAMSRLNN